MKPVHILLVEDNEGDILLTKEALSEGKLSNRVSVIKDGWEAIQFLESQSKTQKENLPDLILMDVNLPKMNGHEVVRHLKSSPHLKHIPVIMLTTSVSPSDIAQSQQNQANCFITKPIQAGDFLKVVTTIEDLWISLVKRSHK